MKSRLRNILGVIGAAGMMLNASSALAGSVTYDFSTDPTTDANITISGGNDTPWQATGGNPGGFLALLYSINSTAEVIVFPDIDNGQTVASFKFETDLRIGNAQGNAGRPADGFSVNFARAEDPVLSDLPTSANAANMAMNGQPENGTATGIAIGFDTWSGNIINDDPTGDIEGIIVRVDNHTILKYGMGTRNGACDDTTSLQTGPYNDAYWTTGLADAHDPQAWAGLCWAHLSCELDAQGKLTISYKGKTILDHFQTTYFPSVGHLVLAGRTGGANENTHFDNIKITTVPSDQPLLTGLSGDALGFTAQVTDSTVAAVNTSTFVVQLNGTTVTPVITKNGLVSTLVYKGATLQASGVTNAVSLTYKDANNNSYSASRSYVVPVYASVPASFVVAAGVDTTKPGFKVKPYQVSGGQPNQIAWTEDMFNGLHGANIADLTQTINGQPIDSNGYYTVTDVVNWDKEGGADGNFTLNNGYTDATLPGQPGGDGTYNNDGEEVLTYVQFPAAGMYKMGVNSDDGFKVSALAAAPIDKFNQAHGVQLGIFDAGRGASDTIFNFYIPQAGIYPMRLLWENGGSGANCEWFSVQADGSKVLVGDPDATNTTGIKAFYSGPLGSFAKSIVTTPATITIVLQDGTSAVVPASVKLSVNNASVTPTTTSASGVTTITYSPAAAFASGSTNSLTLVYADGLGSKTNDLTFVTAIYVSVPPAWVVPANLVDTTKIGFKVKPYQVASGQPNSMAWTEEMYAGLHGTNISDLTQTIDGQAIDALGYYTVTNVVNWDKEGGSDGNFNGNSGYTDITLPGQPAGDGSGTYNNDGEEVLTYMKFPTSGFYTMGVNSDDGFKVSVLRASPYDVLNKGNALQLGIFDAGRGAADTLFNFYVPTAGIYPMRLLWENGGSGANCEWFSVAADGTKFLINDPDATNTTGIKVYVPAAAAVTYISNVIPVPNGSGIVGNAPITVTILEGSDKVDNASIKLTINGGAPVTPTVTKTGTEITATYTPTTPIAGGTTATIGVAYTAGGTPRTDSWSYRVTVLGPGTLFIEAEDWNFEHGKWLTNTAIGMTGKYIGGDYQDKGDGLGGAAGDGTDFGIDYNDNNNTSDQAIYRPNTPVEAGKRNGPAGFFRGTFDVEINHNIGWTDAAEWMNYTREFPAGDHSYKVFARMAHGDAPSRRGGVLSLVTSDPSVVGQATTALGTFSAPWTGGWDTWPDSGTPADALIPMKDSGGADAVVKLSGVKTLRFQYAEQAGDFDYLAFVPTGPVVTGPNLSIATGAAGITITFGGTLQSADTVNGTYTDVAGATSPRVITLPPAGTQKYYRAKQ